MNQEKFKQLVVKISNGTASQKEIALYSYYYDQFQNEEAWDETVLGKKSDMESEIRKRIHKRTLGYGPKFVRFPVVKIAVAAMLLIMGSVLFFLMNQRVDLKQNQSLVENQNQDDVEPGTTRAILILSDGRTLDLDASQNGILANQGDVQVEKNEDGQVAYITNSDKHASATVFNTIKIPKGGRYQLKLPDGTNVWLNSASSLRFPVTFSEKSRVVELDGEAYFEVASLQDRINSKRKPFIVKTISQEIIVLGTQFNVNAYRDEGITKTTLLEGKVKVFSVNQEKSEILNPGQQSLLLPEGNIRVLEKDIDVEEVMAWKNGVFYFNNTELSVIMRQLARWYDVEVDIKNIPLKKFNGELPRNVKLSQVLQMMEKTSGLKFKVEGRRILMIK